MSLKGLLFPQQNHHRNLIDTSGIWEFQADPDEVGELEQWFLTLPSPRFIPVPGTWNDLFDDLKNYLGLAWYRQSLVVPASWRGQRVFLRVGSANYEAKIWVNGKFLSSHHGGHLPFVTDITDALVWDKPNLIAISVENKPLPERVPSGPTPTGGLFGGPFTGYPATTYDFFPYAGLQRAVLLYSVPETQIDDLTVVTTIDGIDGLLEVRVKTSGETAQRGKIQLENLVADFELINGEGIAKLRVPKARLWSPEDPHLYALTVTLEDAGNVIDSYTLNVGIRTIEVKGDQILLNHKPIYLTGFGRHEDFPISGRSTNLSVIVRDLELMRWMGANSFRATHYPHSEETAQLADKLGILIIAEIPAVSFNFADSDELIEARFAQCQVQLEELIQRDKNHPSVIVWNIANEPMVGNPLTGGGSEHGVQMGLKVFEALYKQAKSHDPSRPVTLVGVMNGPRAWLDITDFISINRYNGWYAQVGQLDVGIKELEKEIDEIYATYKKPVLFTEFGADTIAGMHNQPSEMWTEEYQVEFLREYLDLADKKPYVVGMQMWVFADFKTGQGIFRVNGLNHKGVFTRDRRPKMAAHFLKSRWKKN
jgi:beta-glucuronidase